MPLASVTSACRGRCTRGPARAASNGRTGCTSTIWWCIQRSRTRAPHRRFGSLSGARGRGPRGRRIPLTSSLPPRGYPLPLEFRGLLVFEPFRAPVRSRGRTNERRQKADPSPQSSESRWTRAFVPWVICTTRGVNPRPSQKAMAPWLGAKVFSSTHSTPSSPANRAASWTRARPTPRPPPPVPGPDHDPGELQGPLVGESRGDPDLAVGHPHDLTLVLGHQDHRVLGAHGLPVLEPHLVVEAGARGEHPPVALHPVELLEQGHQGRDVLGRGLPDLHVVSPPTRR